MASGKLILIIEDDVYIRGSLQEFLELEGYRIRTAQNGKEGLEVLAALPQSPTVILLDLMMPVMDGRSFLEVKVNQPNIANIPVIVVTASGEKIELESVIATLRKPLDLELLLRTIESAA